MDNLTLLELLTDGTVVCNRGEKKSGIRILKYINKTLNGLCAIIFCNTSRQNGQIVGIRQRFLIVAKEMGLRVSAWDANRGALMPQLGQ